MMHLLSMTGPAQANAALEGGFLAKTGSAASASSASWKVVYVFVRYVCPERHTQSGNLTNQVCEGSSEAKTSQPCTLQHGFCGHMFASSVLPGGCHHAWDPPLASSVACNLAAHAQKTKGHR